MREGVAPAAALGDEEAAVHERRRHRRAERLLEPLRHVAPLRVDERVSQHRRDPQRVPRAVHVEAAEHPRPEIRHRRRQLLVRLQPHPGGVPGQRAALDQRLHQLHRHHRAAAGVLGDPRRQVALGRQDPLHQRLDLAQRQGLEVELDRLEALHQRAQPLPHRLRLVPHRQHEQHRHRRLARPLLDEVQRLEVVLHVVEPDDAAPRPAPLHRPPGHGHAIGVGQRIVGQRRVAGAEQARQRVGLAVGGGRVLRDAVAHVADDVVGRQPVRVEVLLHELGERVALVGDEPRPEAVGGADLHRPLHQPRREPALARARPAAQHHQPRPVEALEQRPQLVALGGAAGDGRHAQAEQPEAAPVQRAGPVLRRRRPVGRHRRAHLRRGARPRAVGARPRHHGQGRGVLEPGGAAVGGLVLAEAVVVGLLRRLQLQQRVRGVRRRLEALRRILGHHPREPPGEVLRHGVARARLGDGREQVAVLDLLGVLAAVGPLAGGEAVGAAAEAVQVGPGPLLGAQAEDLLRGGVGQAAAVQQVAAAPPG
ncbi:MAG: hypothetical protein R3F59_20390 [Myxococcota bacterium]